MDGSGQRALTPSVQSIVDDIPRGNHASIGRRCFEPLLTSLAGIFPSPRLLEVGAGRDPLFTRETMQRLNCRYVVNDVDPKELSRAPGYVDILHGDIADPGLVSDERCGSFDLIFSRMVFEHVHDPRTAYNNIYRLLRPSGGVAVTYIPTLYALPFVVNMITPEKLSSALLRLLHTGRNDDGTPKFPAYYRWCTSTRATQQKITSVGFNVDIIPFFGHRYYQNIPLAKSFQGRVWPTAARRNWRLMSTYAYLICVKPPTS